MPRRRREAACAGFVAGLVGLREGFEAIPVAEATRTTATPAFAIASGPGQVDGLRMGEDAGTAEFLVLSRGQWRRDAAPEDIQGAIDAFYDWLDAHVAAGRMRIGQRLAREGATVSARGIALDGPFGETKELVGGYWFAIAGSLAEAAALLSSSPTLPLGLFYELRPLEPVRASAWTRSNETPD